MAAGTQNSRRDSLPQSVVHGSALTSFFIPGPAGRLEALLNEGDPAAPFVALLCHPHPLGGGTMHNKVVYHAAKVFSGLGWPVLRFNFRGAGLSQGQHDGHEEVKDALAGLYWLASEFGKPIVAAGFSFGSVMGLQATRIGMSSGLDIRGFAALGLPTNAEGRTYTYEFLADCMFPKLFLSGDRDQYAPVACLETVVSSAPSPKQLELIEGADHFFASHLQKMQGVLEAWLQTELLDQINSTPRDR